MASPGAVPLRVARSRQIKLYPVRTSHLRLFKRYSSTAEPDLKATLRDVIPAKRELLKKVKSHANKTIGEVKVENTLGGMREVHIHQAKS
ncbi:MAG: hypothetical protein Q9219_004107 [cf. Caloplaca sp. 3 TL-2023]